MNRFRLSAARYQQTIFMAIFSVSFMWQTPHVTAQGKSGVLTKIMKKTAGVADDIPIKSVDGALESLTGSKAVRESVDQQISSAGKATNKTRSANVRELIQAGSRNLDSGLIRQLDQLDGPAQEVAVVLIRGGDQIKQTFPDIAIRGKLLREGGPETVAAIGMHGRDAAKAAYKVQQAIEGGSVVVKSGGRAVTLADFGKVMSQGGNASWKFWKTHIEPHWKMWAGGGALAVYLSNPEYFQDELGNLTEKGFENLINLVGRVAADAIKGLGKGAANATQEITDSIWETYFQKNWLYAVIGTVGVLALVSLMFRRVRYQLGRPFRWLNQSPDATRSSKPKS